MWFMSFGSDIHVFICMGFGLGGCIWWVSSWFLQWWLSKACYGEYNVYWLFGASQRFKLFLLEDIMIFGIMGLLLMWCKYCGKYL